MKLVPNTDSEFRFCEFVSATRGNVRLVKTAYGKAANKLKFSDGRAFKHLAVEVLECAANRELLGAITAESIPVVGRSVAINTLTIEQILARFTYLQRALGALLHSGSIEFHPLLYGQMQERNLCVAINDPQEVCEFLFSFIQNNQKYGHDELLVEQLQQHLATRLNFSSHLEMQG